MAKATSPAVKVPYGKLVALLGKAPKDPAVLALMAECGKVSTSSDYIVAKEAGFDFALSVPKNGTKKVLSSLFLFPEGGDKHRGFADLPKGLAFSHRAALLATLGAPTRSWKIGKGSVPVDTDGVAHDTWKLGDYNASAHYGGDDRAVRYFIVSQPEEETGGRALSTNPLHFETKPADAPADAHLVGMALLVAWAATTHGLPKKHAGTPAGKDLLAKKLTPRAFLVAACERTLTSLDVHADLVDFLYGYTHNMFGDPDDARKPTAKAIQKLLRLSRPDERYYADDFLGTFKDAVANPFHVPDSWDAVARIAPVLDARWADYQKTKLDAAPDLALYEKAAKARDAVKVTATKAAIDAPPIGDDYADALVALIGKSLKDPDVKATLARGKLPVGKTIDEQANPAIGVSYMGSKFEIAKKRELGVSSVSFYASKQTSYIRGIGAEVQFAGYPAALPKGLSLGDDRKAVAKKLGKPKSSSDTNDYWEAKGIRTTCQFSKSGKLVQLYVGLVRDE